MCPYHTYLHVLNRQTVQRRSVNGPACHLDLNGYRWYVAPDGDLEIITLIG